MKKVSISKAAHKSAKPTKRSASAFKKVKFSKSQLLIFSLIFALIGGYVILKTFAASVATVTVTNTTGAPIQTQLSTNIVPYFPLNTVAGAQAKFNALHPPYVRLHIGHDSSAQPEERQNLWANQGESRAFESLDELVSEVYAANQQILMNIKYAPPWQWTCSTNQGQGTVRDLTFQEYAQYMARIVDYYNNGHMTTETGTVINNPLGTSHRITYWEPWNEPDLNNETPCAPANGFGITYQQYTTMWNAVTTAMLAKDNTLKFVGPATAGGQFGSGASGNQYIDYLMAHYTTAPTALSFHGYGYWDNSVSDHWVFDGDGSCGECGGISAFASAVGSVHATYPSLPIWLTEVNVNADWGNDSHKRPISEFSAAWWGSMFVLNAPMNAGIIHQYDVLDDIQFGLINVNNGNTFVPYHVFALLNQYFPQGSTILSSSSDTPNVQQLAVRTPSGHTSVLVVNRQLVNNTVASNCGVGGVPVTVSVNLPATPASVTLHQIDKNNMNCSTNTGTAASSVTEPATANQTISFPGYGIAVLDVTPTGGSDTTAPTVSMTAPTNGATVSGASVPVSANASDNVGVIGVQFKLDGANIGNEDTTSPYSINWDSTTTTNGSHSLTAVARDAAGNSNTSTAVTVTVNNANPPPTVTINANPGTITSGGSSTLTWSSSNATSCTGSGAWSGSKATSGNQSVSPTTTSTYTLTCTGAGGSNNASATVTVTTGGVLGDCNGDGHVTIIDLSTLLSHYATAYVACDFNTDGVVNIIDLSTLLSHYGT